MKNELFNNKVKEMLQEFEMTPSAGSFDKIKAQLGNTNTMVQETPVFAHVNMVKYGIAASFAFILGMLFMNQLNQKTISSLAQENKLLQLSQSENNLASNQTRTNIIDLKTAELEQVNLLEPEKLKVSKIEETNKISNNEIPVQLAKNNTKLDKQQLTTKAATNSAPISIEDNVAVITEQIVEKEPSKTTTEPEPLKVKINVAPVSAYANKEENGSLFKSKNSAEQTHLYDSELELANFDLQSKKLNQFSNNLHSSGIKIHGGIKSSEKNIEQNEVLHDEVVASQEVETIDEISIEAVQNQNYSLYKYNGENEDGITYKRIETDNNNIRFFSPVKE